MIYFLDVNASSIDFSNFITALTGTVTPAQILAILASVVGVGITFVLMWMGVKIIVSVFIEAVLGRFFDVSGLPHRSSYYEHLD